MGLQLPGELISLLGMLGYTWPEADETKLFGLGSTWIGFVSTLQTTASDADIVAQRVWTENQGRDFEEFQRKWQDIDSAVSNLVDAGDGCLMVGAGLLISAGVVLALKLSVITQLTLLAIQIAQAIATAGPTFGASLAEISIFKMITGIVIDLLIDQAIQALLND